MPSPTALLISSTRVEEGHHDRVTVWNRGGNAGTLTVQKGDGAEVAARLELTEERLSQRYENVRAAAIARIVDDGMLCEPGEVKALKARVAELEEAIQSAVDVYVREGLDDLVHAEAWYALVRLAKKPEGA